MAKPSGHVMSLLTQLAVENSQPTFNLSLILATVWVVKYDFAVYTSSSVVMGQYAQNIPSHRYQNDLMDEILKRSMNPQVDIKFLVEGETAAKDVSEKTMSDKEQLERFFKRYSNREKSIWFLDSMEAFTKFEKDLLDKNNHYHRNGYFLIVYTGIEPQRLANVKEIFNRLLNIYVLNVNVMFMVGKYPYLYTYFPFAKNKCHSSQPEYYVSFRGVETTPNFTLPKRLYPSKVLNMYGCEITVITWTYPPYIFVEQDKKTGELQRLHGIEGSLITLLSQLMNFTIRIIEPELKDRGELYPNGTSTGAAKMIIEAQANITIISYMYNKERSDIMQASTSYLNIPYVLAIPGGTPMTPFQRLIKPFRYIIWSCFSSSFFFAIVFIYSLRSLGKLKLMDFIYGRGNRTPFSNLLATLFGGAIHGNVPYRNFARFLLTVWLLYTFVLRTAYSGQLFLILQDGSARNTLQSLQEVVERNYTIYAFPAVEKVLKQTEEGVHTATIDASNTVPNIFKRISQPNTKEKIALCLLDYSIRTYNQRNPMRRVDILSEPLLTSPIVFYMPHHSYLKATTTDFIMGILQAGIMKRFVSSYLYASPKKVGGKGEPMKLSCHVLLGIFSVYGVFLLVGIVIFVLEMTSMKSLWVKCLIDFLNM